METSSYKESFSLTLWIILILILYLCVSPVIPLLKYYELFSANGIFLYPFIIFLLLYTFTYLKRFNIYHVTNLNRLSILSFSLFVAIVLIQLFYYFVFKDADFVISSYYNRLFQNTLYGSLVMFFLGCNINLIKNIQDIKGIRVLVNIVFWLYIAFILYGVIINPYRGVFGFRIHFEREFNYLNIADSFVVYSFLAISLAKKKSMQYFYFLVTLIASVALASRSSTILFVIVMLIYFLLAIKPVRNKRYNLKSVSKFLFVSMIFILILIVVGIKYFDINSFSHTRLGLLFSSGANDSSLQSRIELFNTGLSFIQENWLLGFFGGEIFSLGAGHYIHNWLSFWGAYGIFPFMVSLIVMLFSTIKIFRLIINYKDNFIIKYLFFLHLFCLLSVWLSRSYTFETIWFSLIAIPLLKNEELLKGPH